VVTITTVIPWLWRSAKIASTFLGGAAIEGAGGFIRE
jgi:hypothetical protein